MKKPATIHKQYLYKNKIQEAKSMKKNGIHFLRDHPENTSFEVDGGENGTLLKINPGSCKVKMGDNVFYTLISPNTIVI